MVALIPLEVLFGNPERTSPRISPEGGRLAWIAPHAGVLNVFVAPIGPAGGEGRAGAGEGRAGAGEAGGDPLEAAQVVTDDTDRGIRSFGWAHDGRHIVYVQDTGGDENWRLYDVDLQTMERRDLTPFDGVQAQIVATDKTHPGEILVGLNKDNPELHDVYRLELASGELTKIVENPGYIGWVADRDLVVRAAASPTPEGGYVLMVRDSAEAPWRPLFEIPPDDALTTSPFGFSADGRSLYAVSSIGADTGRLVRIDVETGEATVLAEDPEADVVDVLVHPDTREPQIVMFMKDRTEYLVLDPDVAADLDAIRAAHPGDPQFIGRDHDDRTWLVAFTDDAGSAQYYRYDRATRTPSFLFNQQPALAAYELARMEPFVFSSRDGLAIHGYVSFPPGSDRRAMPAVLVVHGGPWARDVWGFDSWAQWLANRGFVCVQVNFRGSTGYGKAFVNAGDKQWGAKMHDDLVDAVGFVVEKGWVDPKRVAIFGGSYGGYAALVGVTFTPRLFCCGVDVVGPSNLKTLIETVPPYWAPEIATFHRRVGNPETDQALLWERSPLSKADQIVVPLLIAQGANDPRVKQSESEQIVAALIRAGIDYEYLLYPDEGHGFAKPENRLAFVAAAEAFLARHLGGHSPDVS